MLSHEATDNATDDVEQPVPVRHLTRPQRRVLGVLVEKGLTTPDSYPLTLKALTAGCNQKSNRDPVTNYSEDSVEDILDELRQLGLVAVVHTESGRTERYRHYVRKRYPFTEQQLAVVTELLLRGRQQLGELRSRASRMVPIDTQEELRENLRQLAADNYVRSSGPLERRGVEVDHLFYGEDETPEFDGAHLDSHSGASGTAPVAAVSGKGVDGELNELREQIAELKAKLDEVSEDVVQLKRNLGV